MLVTKADGTIEEFNSNKLRRSLKRAGASNREIEDIEAKILSDMKDRTSTQQIYRAAFEMLRVSTKPVAARYSLRRALFGLGPTGFPFEDFLARLFEEEGYRTLRRTTIQGKCAVHEIDLAGYKTDSSFVAEAKFHVRPGLKSDLQVTLYSYARYLDLESHPVCKDDVCHIDTLYVITNTKFTSTALEYAKCVGLELLSWGYPENNSLQDRVERLGIYPVTALGELSNREKEELLKNQVILCKDVLKNPNVLATFGVSRKKVHAVIEEARQLCGE